MLNRFLDLKNLCVATKSMCLAHILKKKLRILSFGGHLGHHLEYYISISPMWHHSVSMYGHIGEHIYAKLFCADYFFGLYPKSSFGNLTICIQFRICRIVYQRLDSYGVFNFFSHLFLNNRLG